MEKDNVIQSSEESLNIIGDIISQAKGRVSRDSFYYLLWGWVVVIANLGHYALIKIGYPMPWLIWAIGLPAWIISFVYGMKRGEKTGFRSHFDRVNMWLWITFGISVIILIVFGQTINYRFNPIILLFAAIPTFVSGIILRFKYLIYGGIAFWVFAIICYLVSYENQFIVAAIGIGAGYLMPGYALKKAGTNENV